jgi:putative ABC transport system ATP-binding protein
VELAYVLSLRGISRTRGEGSDSFRLEVPTFEVAAGACLALTGASGSGKSTMLDLLGLVLRPDRADRFRLELERDGGDVDVAALWARDDRNRLAAVRARCIGYVLQTGGLLPFLSAGENVQLSRRVLGLGADDALVARLIAALGIAHLLRKKPRALSIGERQRVAIARALAHRPKLLLADEPTAALDPGQAVDVMTLLLDLVHGLGVTAIVVTHDWELVQTLGLRQVRAEPLAAESGSASRFAC